MSDHTDVRGPADRTKINVNEAYELQYWSVRFGCTTDELWDAVSIVGVQVDDVAEFLNKPELASSTVH